MMYQSQFIEMVGNPRTNPKGWPMKRLPDVASYTIGLTYKPENVCEDGTIVLRSGNIQEGEIDLYDLVRVNTPIRDNLWVKEGDILMCSRNGSASLVGKVAQIKSIKEPMTYGAFMTIIRSDYSDYLYLYFQSGDFRDQISGGKSSTMNQITQKMLDKIEIPLPNQQIINSLSAILKQADKSKFDGFKSQFIEMFKEAPIVKLGDHIDTQSGGTPNTKKAEYYEGGDIPWLSSGEVNQGYINGTEKFITKAGLDNSSAKWSPEHSIVIAMYGATAGKVGYLNVPVTTNQAVCTLLPSSYFVPKFLYYAVSNKSSWMVSQCQGAAQPNISQGIIRKMEIPMPEKSLQEEFVLIVEQADKSKSVCRQAIKRLAS